MRECVLLGCLVATGILTADVARAEPTSGKWYHSYSQAFHNAKRLDKPLVVHFYADWCGPCQQMESSVLNTAEVTAKLGQTIIGVKINVDRYPELVEGFRIDSFPSDVFVATSGKILSRSGGYSSRKSLRQIDQAAKSAAALPAIKRGNAPRDTNAPPALEGYSPVAITQQKKWLKGDRKFAWEYKGIVYHVRNSNELTRFQANPERYIPELSGQDPLVLATRQQGVRGDIQYGAFYRHRLYLLASEENRLRFIEEPQRYADSANVSKSQEVKLDPDMTGAE